MMSSSLFPPGTPVCVKQVVERRDDSYVVNVVGVVESWEESPTGSWHAFGLPQPPRNTPSAAKARDGKLWLRRLKLRKADGEIAFLVIDDSTEIAKIEASNA
jgi:hypothetical protein